MRSLGLFLLLFLQGAALAAEPAMITDAGRITVHPRRVLEHRVVEPAAPVLVVRPRPCCTGYVGSAYGLGKPNYYGISPRPDDGFSDVLR